MQEFEEIRALMREENKALTEQHFIESFIGDLNEEIGKLVTLQKPGTLLEAIQVVVQSEELVQLFTKNQKSYPKNPLTTTNLNVTGDGISSKPRIPPIKRLLPEEMRARRERNLCFNCDEVFHIGDKCKKLYLILMENDGEEPEDTLTLEIR